MRGMCVALTEYGTEDKGGENTFPDKSMLCKMSCFPYLDECFNHPFRVQ